MDERKRYLHPLRRDDFGTRSEARAEKCHRARRELVGPKEPDEGGVKPMLGRAINFLSNFGGSFSSVGTATIAKKDAFFSGF